MTELILPEEPYSVHFPGVTDPRYEARPGRPYLELRERVGDILGRHVTKTRLGAVTRLLVTDDFPTHKHKRNGQEVSVLYPGLRRDILDPTPTPDDLVSATDQVGRGSWRVSQGVAEQVMLVAVTLGVPMEGE